MSKNLVKNNNNIKKIDKYFKENSSEDSSIESSSISDSDSRSSSGSSLKSAKTRLG